jgi:thiamine biosynthesis protein ThiI
MKPIIIVHHHEIGLKGKNRNYFEKHLLKNVRTALQGLIPPNNIQGGYGRFVIDIISFEEQENKILDRLKKIFGISNICLGVEVEQTIEAFNKSAEMLLADRKFSNICVRTKRANKNFQPSSPEVNRIVGEYLCNKFQVRANLTQPDEIVFIEIVNKTSYVYLSKINGAGGLPAGISGKVVSLTSAGFDSPVASYQMMKRGAQVIFVHFHSFPYVSRDSIDQVQNIVKALTQYQYISKLFLVPFAEFQQDVVLKTPMPLRVILYRRMMVRAAEKIAYKESANALVTGESLGQVASQTLRNIRIVNDVANLPILRPLVGTDKEDIIRMAREIGTHDISREPYDDCCSFLNPRTPETWADPEKVTEAESKLDINGWINKLLEKTEKIEFNF